jgi:hypothetical protein
MPHPAVDGLRNSSLGRGAALFNAMARGERRLNTRLAAAGDAANERPE